MVRVRELMRRGESKPKEKDFVKTMRNKVIPKRFHYPDGSTRPWSILEIERMERDEK